MFKGSNKNTRYPIKIRIVVAPEAAIHKCSVKNLSQKFPQIHIKTPVSEYHLK